MRNVVYFIASDDLLRVKIGTTDGLDRRRADLQRCCPSPLLLLAEIDGGYAVEATLHQRFADARLHGEWFQVTEDLAALIYDVQVTGRRWAAERFRAQYLIDYHHKPGGRRGALTVGTLLAKKGIQKVT